MQQTRTSTMAPGSVQVASNRRQCVALNGCGCVNRLGCDIGDQFFAVIWRDMHRMEIANGYANRFETLRHFRRNDEIWVCNIGSHCTDIVPIDYPLANVVW